MMVENVGVTRVKKVEVTPVKSESKTPKCHGESLEQILGPLLSPYMSLFNLKIF